jgi:hypothetical protein
MLLEALRERWPRERNERNLIETGQSCTDRAGYLALLNLAVDLGEIDNPYSSNDRWVESPNDR